VVVVDGEAKTYALEISAPPVPAAARATAASASSALWDASYSSETGRLSTSVDSAARQGSRTTRVSATNVTQLGATRSDVRSSVAAATFEIGTPARRFTLFDQFVRSSRLTLDGSRVRGAHYHDAAFDLHAGLSSPLLYRSVVLPARPDAVIGGSFTKHRGTFAFGPSMYWYPNISRFGGARGVAAGARLAHETRDGRFRFGSEAAYGSALAGAADLAYDTPTQHVVLSAVHRPSGFPSLGAVAPYGTSFDGQWLSRLSPRFTVTLLANGARQQLPLSDQRTGTASAELRTAVTRHIAVTFGSNAGVFDNGIARATSVTLPIGAGWESAKAGVTGLFRYQQNTDRNRGGAGGRLRAHASIRGFAASGFVDYQRDAATVGLVFRESPELARAFAELGFEIRTPEDLARLLREPDALIASGYLQGTTLILNPRRVQAGIDATWRTRGDGTRIRVSVLGDGVESTRGAAAHTIETLAVTRRLTRAAEVTATGSWWTAESGTKTTSRWSYVFGLRLRGRSLADIGSWVRRETIGGRVLRDSGDGSPASAAMPGVRVRLEDGRETVTDAAGRFRFSGVSGAQRVEALLPDAAGARFTTPASVVASPGVDANFTIGFIAPRVIGIVRDDAGAPIAGVRITMKCGTRDEAAVTNTEGRYAMNGPEGSCRVAIDGASLPAGYDPDASAPQGVALARDVPAHADYVIRANRSLSGKVRAGVTVTVRLLETGDVRRADPDGRFVFRNLKPGTYTVVADTAERRIRQSIVIPDGPAVVTIELNLNN
jgi:hypothetical protein